MLIQNGLSMFEKHCNKQKFAILKIVMNTKKYSLIGVQTSSCFDAGVAFGTSYSYKNACQVCGTGAEQVSELRIPLSKAPSGEIACSWFGHIIVQRPLFLDLLKSGLDEKDTRRVEWKKPVTTEWFQLLPRFVLPPMDRSSRGFKKSDDPTERSCPVCRRDGNWGDPSSSQVIVLSRARLAERISDVARINPNTIKQNICIFFSWECMAKSLPGNSIPPRLLAFPMIVINDVLLDVFVEHCGKKFVYDSVEFVD